MLMTRENDYVIVSGGKKCRLQYESRCGGIPIQYGAKCTKENRPGSDYLCVVGLWVIIRILFNSVQCL